MYLRTYFGFLSLLGFGTPTIEDSMAMVGVALVLYLLIKIVSWIFTSSGIKLPRSNLQ